LLASSGTRCGDLPPFETVEMTLTPETVSAGEQVTVVASFDRNVFDNVGFYVDSIDAHVLDANGVDFIGQFYDSAFRQDMGEPPFVSGVILAGEVLDDRTFQMTLEFPAGTAAASLPVEVGADTGAGDCGTGILGKATLAVADGS
jgi:hypothetical protein